MDQDSQKPTKALLLKEITSNNGKSKTVYGSKNELVSIISNRGNVLIVEGKTGRYSVKGIELREI